MSTTTRRGQLWSAPGRTTIQRFGEIMAASRLDTAPLPVPTTVPTTVGTKPSSAAGPTFGQLGVPANITKALATQGITSPFPIQTATLPDSLAGRDVLGRGRTGSGKTYAFAIPLLARLAASGSPRRPGRPRALILAPTRELASQIDATLTPIAQALGLRTLTVFGGVSPGRQISGLRSGVDIVVACPGRLADHIQSGHANLDAVEITILDEADHMADLGFLPVVKRLMDQTPSKGQRMLFSATLDGGVDVLVRRFLKNPVTHSVDSVQSPVTEMSHHVLHIQHQDRLAVLTDLVAAPGRTLVFTRTKRGAKVLTRRLIGAGVPAVELHGNLAQNARTRNLEAFSTGAVQTLVATDIAARGIHVDDIGLVVHFDPPIEHKAYLHRSGRTARAGAAGTVVTLMTDDQVGDVRDLARKAGIAPTTTRLGPGHALLGTLAPGERSYVEPPRGTQAIDESAAQSNRPRRQSNGSSASKQGGGRGASGGRGSGGRGAAGGRGSSGRSGGGAGGGSGGGASAANARVAGSKPTSRRGSGARSSAARSSGPRTTGAAAFSASSNAGRRGGR
jgi:superfamily II DNA/RNA helicase